MTKPAKQMLDALKFVGIAQRRAGKSQERHIRAAGGRLFSSNGWISASHPIEEEFDAFPHSFDLAAALKGVPDEYAITTLPDGHVAITAGPARVVVPCAPHVEIPEPDAPCGPADDALRDAIAAVAPAVASDGLKPDIAGVLVQSGSCVGTDGHAIAESWHGRNMPRMVIPLRSVKLIARQKIPLAQFGFSESSITLYYENGAWIKAQLLPDGFPGYEHIFKRDLQFSPIPEGFHESVKYISQFGKDKIKSVIFDKAGIKNGISDNASSYEIAGLADEMAIDAKYVIALKKSIAEISFDENGNTMYFRNQLTRGAIVGLDMPSAPEAVTGSDAHSKPGEDCEDDIPY